MKGICKNAKSLDAFPLADSITLRFGQKHRDCIFSICANRERAACVLWFKQTRSKFHLWWLVITCNECLFLDHPNPSLGMSKIILPGRNLQVTKSLTQISAICKTWRTCEMHIWRFYVPASQRCRDFSKADWNATIEKDFRMTAKGWSCASAVIPVGMQLPCSVGMVQQIHQRVTAQFSGRHYQGMKLFVHQSMVTCEGSNRILTCFCP